MATDLPPLEPRRPRRGSLDRPVNSRLYRAAFLLVLVPVIGLAVTVRKPLALTAPQLPPTFDTRLALATAQDVATRFPDRSPGSPGAAGARAWIEGQLADYGYAPTADSFTATIPGEGRRTLTNVIAVAPGRTAQAIVVAAHRDNNGQGPGANDNASGTAALVEMARSYGSVTTGAIRTQQPAHTIVFLSTDGGADGSIGAARFAADPRWRKRVVAVVNLDAVAGHRGARIELSGDAARSPAAALVQTAAARILEQTGHEPRHTGPFGQLLDLALPFSLYDQAPFVGRGIPAITLTTAGIRPDDAFTDTPGRLNERALGAVGRASEQLVESLDEGLEIARGTSTYIWLGNRVVAGWAIELLLLTLLLPYLAAVIDLFARSRRLGVRVAPAVRAYRSRLAACLWAGVLFELFRALGLWPAGAPRPIDPASHAATVWPIATLAVLGALILASWIGGRERRVPHRRATPEELLAGHAGVLLALGLIGILTLAVNPYSLLFLLPSLHAWLWAAHVPDRRLLRLALLVAGLAGPAAIVVSFAVRFEIGWDTPWYLLVLAGVGKLPYTGIALSLAWVAALSQILALVAGRYAPYPAVHERGLGPGRRAVRMAVLARRRRKAVRVDQIGAPARRQGKR